MSFVHLHAHSHYSLLDGVPKIDEFINAVKKHGMPAVALTDHGNMYGAIEFYEAAKAAGVKPILGMEAYMAPGSLHDRQPKEKPFHLILLAQNAQGYRNLVKLATIAQLEGFYYKPRIDFDLLKKYGAGLIMLSGCLSGEVARAIRHQSVDAAQAVVEKFLTLFDRDHFYLEVQHNPNTPEQNVVNAGVLELHRRTGIGIVGTNDVHYIHPEDSEAQDVLLCIQTKRLLAEENRFSMRHDDWSLISSAEAERRFRDFPGAVENTLRIADMVNIELELGTIQIPHYPLPDGVTAESYLAQLCEEGLRRKYELVTSEIRQRLTYELDIIGKTGFASYFLIVQDFINWAKQQGIAVGPGRGSAAGSLVSYLTNITDIDPIRYELLFERFLNPERVSQPDIDTDFADSRRDDVLRYVEQKYGKDHVAQIITFGTMAARAAVRDVGRVMGFSYGYCDRIAKLIPMFTTLEEAVTATPELKELMNQDPDAERLIATAKKLEGVARHTSIHACAVVITKDPLDTSVPLQLEQEEGTIITQYSMHPIEDLGLLKMDFLGLKNLTIIEHSLSIIRATTGTVVDMERIPLNDKKTFRLLQEANTIGVFQLESSGMRRYLKQLRPTEIEDIIAMVSLYRPGPMDFIPEYIDGKHGKKQVTYLNERLRPILQKTYGIAVYQEQIMEIARQLAGYTYGEADVLRKAVGKKIKSLLDEQEQKMVSGMMKNGISQDVAKKIWEFILPFARYGFNRSHAACYAMIAYRTAYLKANYPAQFMAALLTADYGNTERVAFEIQHAQHSGLQVLPPDINQSFGMFSVIKESLSTERPQMRFGLKAIKNVGDHIVDVIISERKRNGAYASVEDFLRRVNDRDLNKKSLESLIKVGALDALGERNQLLLNMEVLLQYAKGAHEEKTSGQVNLFGSLGAAAVPKLTLSPVPEAPESTRLSWEKELLGLYISGHPLEHLRAVFERFSVPFNTLKDYPKRKTITLIGSVTTMKRITTKSGDPMLFAGIADHTGEIEALVFPKTYQKNIGLWMQDTFVKVTGKLDDKDGELKILVEEASRFTPEKDAAQQKVIQIIVPKHIKKTVFADFTETLKQYPGAYRVMLQVEQKTIDTNSHIHKDAVEKLRALFGQDSLRVIE